MTSVAIGLLAVSCGVVMLVQTRRDATAILTLYLLSLWLIPAQLVFPVAGAIGTPAITVAVGCALWWSLCRLLPDQGIAEGAQPLRFAVLAFGWWMLLAYALAFTRLLTDLEASGADRAAIALIGSCGVALLGADGIASRARLDVLLRRFVVVAVVVASIGIAQSTTNFDPIQYVRVPGLVLNAELQTSELRSDLRRPYSTTLHPIEFSVVCAMALPVALHFARYAPKRRGAGRSPVNWWIAVIIIAAGVPMAVSRSGLLGLLVGLAVTSIAWDWRRRLNVAVAGVFLMAAMRVAVPGLLGTLRSLVVQAEHDPSVQGRLEDLARVRGYIGEAPLFGRGLGTFNPSDYFFLDNQLYGAAIMAGLIGMLVLLFLVAMAGVVSARAVRGMDEETRSLGFSIAGSVAVAAASMMAFDGGFAFPIFNGTLFLLIGCAGALWRLTLPPRAPHILDRLKRETI